MIVVKTPGVYIEEIALFPPSVAQAPTAIPAFIGFTFKAVSADLKPLTNIPVKISSLLEYTDLFGGTYDVKTYSISTAADKIVTAVSPDKRFRLYDSVRQFYDNGGGDCYILSVGDYSGITDGDLISKGMDELKKYDEPTLILFPDAVEMLDGSNAPDFDKMADLHKKALSICASMQDRFAVLDIMQGNVKEDITNQPLSNFRDKIGVNFLNYGAAYYPWIVASYSVPVNYRNLLFPSTDLSNVSQNQGEKDILNTVQHITTSEGALKNTDTVINASGLDPVRLRTEGIIYLLAESDRLKAAVQQSAFEDIKSNLTPYFNFLNALVLALPGFESSLPLGSSLLKDLAQIKKDSNYTDAITLLIAYEKNGLIIDSTSFTLTSLKTIFKPLFTAPAWITSVADAGAVTANGDVFTPDIAGCIALINAMEGNRIVAGILSGYMTLLNAALYYENLAQNNLFSNHSFFKGIAEKITETMCTMPPSGAMAGVYAQVDSTRGVWKAPANVSLNAVIGPAVKIDNKEQEDLNVHSTGKSVNGIRAFTGKGTMVWGARTLAGNDNEWRYIPVRRFFIMVEESVRKASAPFVFEPNDANTWVKVKAMTENFLTLQWRAGALQGAKTEDAFFVHIGLGETMSEDDVLNGKMIVEIGMAVVRPAEFIILRLTQKMMEA